VAKKINKAISKKEITMIRIVQQEWLFLTFQPLKSNK